MKRLLIVSLAMLTIVCIGYAQTADYTGVMKFRARSSGAILKNNSVEGYFVFYPIEKADKKNTTYQIHFSDNNLNKVIDFTVVKPNSTYLLETVFNGEVFMIQFYNSKKKTLEFVTYDRTGKIVGNVDIVDPSKYEMARINQSLVNPEVENTSIWPSGDNGFVRNTYIKGDKLGYQVEKYSNSTNSQWTYGSSPTSKLVEVADVLWCGEKYVGLVVAKKKNLLTREADSFFVLLDAETGSELANVEMKDKADAQLSLLNCFVNESNGESTVVGEFYKPGDDILKDKSMGLYIKRIDSKGSDIEFKKFGWDREIAKFKQDALTSDDKDKDKGTNQMWFHQFVMSSNGSMFAIGEQYRKQVSALGAASKVLGGGASAFEIKMTNMVVIEFDSKLELVDYDLIPKRTSRVTMPEGYGMANAQMLGAYMKAIGAFDYQFTLKNDKNDSYDVVYTDLNRKEENSKEKSDVMIGVITLNKGEKTTQRIPINSDANYLWYAPAKPGFIVIGEYFRKEKTVKMRLEKLTN